MINTTNAARACVAILMAITLSACATRLGRDFDDSYAKQIKPGETTKAEVGEKLGRPPLRRTSGDEETWTYAYYEGKGNIGVVFGFTDPNQGSQKRLTITFKGDRVKESKFVVELPKEE